MLQMASKADLLFSIGPTIYEYFHNAYRADFQGKPLSVIPHEEILPKMMPDFSEKYPIQRRTTTTSNILTCGQLDTQEAIEQCTVIAASIGSVVNQQLQTTLPKWKIQGVSKEVDKTVLVKNLNTNQVQLTLQPGFSADKLLRSLQQSHLCIPAPVYMDYGFIGLEAAVFGLPTVFNDCSELANFIKYHFEEHEADWIAEDGLPKKILQHLKDPSKAFKKAKRLKVDLLQSEVVSGSYAKFASLLTAPLQQQVVHGCKLPAAARDVTETKSDITELQDDQSLSKSQPIHGPEKKEKELGDTIQLQKMGKGEKNETSATTESEIRHEDKKMQDCLTVLLKLDGNEHNKRLQDLKKKYKASSELQSLEAEEKNTVDSAWKVCEQGLKRRIEKVLHDEHDCEEVKRVCKKNLGEVDPYSFSNKSLAILLRFLTHYNLCRLKQTCRSGSLAKAFEPLLITDEMREIGVKVGMTLQLKATYDQEKFAELEIFFINRDGGGIKPLKSYNNVIDEMYIEDHDHDCNAGDGHQQVDGTSMNDVMQSEVPSKMLVLEIDLKLEMKPFTETNVRYLLNPVELTRQRGIQYDILQVVMAMTDRIQHILTSRLEILSLLGFVRYMLTDVADGDGRRRQSIPELEEQLFLNGSPIPPIAIAYETLSLQARSLLLFQISKKQQTDSDIRYLALAKSQTQSVHSQPDIEKSKLLAAKEILENQLAEAQQEKSNLEKRCKELLQEREKDEKVITRQHSDIQILKDKLEKLDRNIKYLQSKLKQKDEFINEFRTKLSDAQSYVELQQIIAESFELGEKFPAAGEKWEGEPIFGDFGETTKHTEIRRIDITSAGIQHSGKARADRKQPELRQEETPEILATTTETSRPVREERTPGEQEATSTETRQIKDKKPGLFGKFFRRLTKRKATTAGRRREVTHGTKGEEDYDDEAVTEKIQIPDGWSKFTLKGHGPSPGQKFNDPCGLTFHDDKLLVCDRLNNIVQILNEDYTCEKVLGSFSGQFAKPFKPVSIAVSKDNHYFILDDSNLQIVVCDQNSKVISTITLPADIDPYCIALLKGFVLVTDVRGHRLLKYTMTGQHVGEFGGLGLGHKRFNCPFFVAVNSRDVIMVSDFLNHCIKCFDAEFNYLYQYGHCGAGDSQLSYPNSIAVDDADHVYVCDGGNDRISMWSGDKTWRCNLFKAEVGWPEYIAVSRDRMCVRGDNDRHITVFSK
ncbi:uncharacterized protein [Ptychodera flava]|uniref:uncharacterized protein n=1 Tax=Ptychodera flava TaxID=63121 RepID=UPI00396A98E1